MPAPQSRFKRALLAIQNTLGFQVCVKRKSSPVNESDEKLLNIFNDLTVGISEVFDHDSRSFPEFLRCDRVSCKINVLNEQIGQVRILYSLWKSGYDLDPEAITGKCQSLNLLVDCIRDDVFYAYLRMPPEQKLELLKKNKQVSSIFSVLGSLENEVTDLVKSMLPNGEIMRIIRPLLEPKYDQMVFRRCARNVFNYNIPHCYQTFQFCYNGRPSEKPTKVDACTDPIDTKEWQKMCYASTDAYGDSFYKNTSYDDGSVDRNNEWVCPCNQRSQHTISSRQSFQVMSPKLMPVVTDQNQGCWDMSASEHQMAAGVKSKTFVMVDSGCGQENDSLPRDRQSIVTDSDDVVGRPSDYSLDEATHSFEKRAGPRPFDRTESDDVNFWKLAADLIVENPVLH